MIKETVTAIILTTTPIAAQSIEENTSSENSKTSFGVEIGSSTKYVSEGIEFNNKHTIETGIDASIFGLSAGVYHNYSLMDQFTNELEFNTEYTIESIRPFKVTFGISYTKYLSDPDTPEGLDFYHNIEYKLFESKNISLTPTIEMMTDIINKGKYIKLSLDGQMEIMNEWNLGLNIGGAYNDKYFREDRGLSHLETQISLNIPINNNLTGTIGAIMINPISANPDTESNMIGNIVLRYEF